MAEVTFEKAKYGARLTAIAIDLVIMIILTLSGMIISQKIVKSTPYFQQAGETMNDVERKSHLYYEDQNHELTLISKYYIPTNDTEVIDVNQKIDNALNSFYKESMFFDQSDKNSGIYLYNKERIDSGYFIYQDSDNQIVVPKSSVSQNDLYAFYTNAMGTTALTYMMNYPGYVEAVKIINLTFIFIVFLIPLVLSVIICQYLFPLIFKRGRKTLGKLIMKIGVVDESGLSPSLGRFTIRFVFILFIEVILSLISFLIPLIVSFTMMLISKKNQAFHDYMTRCYVVSTSQQRIFLSKQEYFDAMNKAKEMDIYKEEIKY